MIRNLLFLYLSVCFAAEATSKNKAQSVVTGDQFTCGLYQDGKVSCWGKNVYGQFEISKHPRPFEMLAAGDSVVCGIDEIENLICAGSTLFEVPKTLGTVKQLSIGANHLCALETKGQVSCWGDDRWGQSTPPTDLKDVTQLAAGKHSTCAQDKLGRVRCWGMKNHFEPPKGLGEVVQISSGNLHICAIEKAGDVQCWPSKDSLLLPPSKLGPATMIASFDSSTCALKQDGTIKCWGYSDKINDQVPTLKVGVSMISVGRVHACLVTDEGDIRCWGHDSHGETKPLQAP